jgi:endonuclease/exonuclease/phosphatase family metal-dependent hydrolase
MVLTSNKNPIFLLLMLVVGCGIFVFYGVKGESREHQLRVVSYNVGTFNGEKPALKRIVDAIGKEGRPGMVLLQEVLDKAFLLAVGERLGLRHHAFGAYTAGGGGYGLGLLSERPLLNPEMHLLKPNGHAVLMAEMGMDGKRVLVCSVHLERVKAVEKKKDGFYLPWEKAFKLLKTELISETPRSKAVAEILNLVALQEKDEDIIGGDFNTVPFSTAIRGMGRRYEDALWLTGDYFTGTYMLVMFPFKPRIDFIFHSVGIRVVSAGVIRDGVGIIGRFGGK